MIEMPHSSRLYLSTQVLARDTWTPKEEGHSLNFHLLNFIPLQELWAWSMSSIAKIKTSTADMKNKLDLCEECIVSDKTENITFWTENFNTD